MLGKTHACAFGRAAHGDDFPPASMTTIRGCVTCGLTAVPKKAHAASPSHAQFRALESEEEAFQPQRNPGRARARFS